MWAICCWNSVLGGLISDKLVHSILRFSSELPCAHSWRFNLCLGRFLSPFGGESKVDLMSDQWYCKVVGEEVGPITEDDLREMFASGQIAINDMIRSSDHTAWQRISRVFPDLTANPPQSRVWYFRSFGDDFGPYTFTELKEFVTQEQLTPTDDVREGEQGDWKPARLVPDLFPRGDDLLAGMESLDDAPAESGFQAKPASESKRRSKKGKRKRAPKEDAESAAAALLDEVPDEPASPAPQVDVAVAAPVADVAPPAPVESPVAATTAAASTTDNAASLPPAAPVPSPPAPPAYTPPKPPPAPRRTSSGGGGGGISLPDWLLNGKTIGIAVGLMVLLGGGYLLMGSGLLNFNAGPVYQQTVALYEEFKTVSKNGPESPAFEKFYEKFRTEQFEMLSAVGDASPGSSAYQVHRAVQTLGSVVQSFRRTSMTQEARQVYVEALENQLKKLRPIYGS